MEFRACVMVQQRAITIANAANKQDCNNGMILNDDNKDHHQHNHGRYKCLLSDIWNVFRIEES